MFQTTQKRIRHVQVIDFDPNIQQLNHVEPALHAPAPPDDRPAKSASEAAQAPQKIREHQRTKRYKTY